MTGLIPPRVNENPDYPGIHGDIVALLEAARHAAARSVNALMTVSYWEIGRRIVEFEQGGQDRAAYGDALSSDCPPTCRPASDVGSAGRTFQQMRLFYLAWPVTQIRQTPSGESIPAQIRQTPPAISSALPALAQAFPLPWSAYVRLLSVKGPSARSKAVQ